jgi:hypothetical protein
VLDLRTAILLAATDHAVVLCPPARHALAAAGVLLIGDLRKRLNADPNATAVAYFSGLGMSC